MTLEPQPKAPELVGDGAGAQIQVLRHQSLPHQPSGCIGGLYSVTFEGVLHLIKQASPLPHL